MRLLILLLALMSAFFVSAQPDMNDLVEPKLIQKFSCYEYSRSGTTIIKVDSKSVCVSMAQDGTKPKTGTNNDATYSNFRIKDTSFNKKPIIYDITYERGAPAYGATSNFSLEPIDEYTKTCPPDKHPNHTIPVADQNGVDMCAKPLPSDPDCPAPTDNDPFVFGSGGGQTSVCFPAQNGRQCAIQTDENGGYYIPASYGSAEPVSCTPDIDPSPDPDPTPDPEPKPAPDPTDPEPEANELDAINKVNENLDVLNQNQSASSESNDERLDRIALEIQNSNELLSAIKGKPVSGGGSNINNGALTEIAENTKPKEFNFNANRKQGGLNDIFTGDDLAQVEQEIEDKKTELADYIEKIKSESKAIFDINTNISGSYTEHKETIKGAEVDLGVGRFSGFFQIIAPALIFVATVAALFIMLGGNKE